MWPLVNHTALYTFKEQLTDGSPHTQALWLIVSPMYSYETTHQYITLPTGHVTNWKITLFYVYYEMTHQWIIPPLSCGQQAAVEWSAGELPYLQAIWPNGKSLYSYGTTHHWVTKLYFFFWQKIGLPKMLCGKGDCHDAKFIYPVKDFCRLQWMLHCSAPWN